MHVFCRKGLLTGSLVVASLLGPLEVADVPDEGGGLAVGGWATLLLLIELVVHDQVLLVVGVEDPTLVSVGGAFVGGNGDDFGERFVSQIVDGEGILVVAVADLTTKVLGVGATVDEALSVVNVAVLGSTSRAGDLGGVAHVEHVNTGSASVVTGLGTNDVGEVGLRVGKDVVDTTEGKVVPEGREVLVGVEGHGALLVVNVQELLQVEELDTVTGLFTAYDEEVVVGSELPPAAGGNACGLRKTSEVTELTSGGDLRTTISIL